MGDIVARASEYLAKWNGPGQEECRRLLAGLSHVEAEDADAAAMVWEMLHFAALPMLAGPAVVEASTLVTFVESLLRALPSSSQDPSPSAESARALSDHLIDAVWSADAALDEQIIDITTRTAALDVEAKEKAGEDAPEKAKDGPLSEWEIKAQAVKARLEKDKETLVEVVKGYMRVGAVDPIQARERLDLALIISSGLIANKANYDRREIRTRTGLFYKQIKFNLSREQSEGFSKLLAELTSSLPPAHSTTTGRPLESTAAVLEQTAPVWDHLFSVVGYFEMDPNRALDIILDVFSTHVATHWSFFLALLSHSPWKGNSSRLYWTSEAEAQEQTTPKVVEGRYKGKDLDGLLLEAEGNRAPPPAPAEDQVEPQARVMAQILGFKFRHYQNPETKETTPITLYSMTALLIREGFITLDELWPHLSPSDEDMEEQDHKAYKESVEKRKSAGTVNKLAMSGALEGGGGSAPQARAPEAKKGPEEKKTPASNQKVGLVTALLAVGALRPALAILCKFPWLKDAYPEISDVILRIMTCSLSSLYDSRHPPKIPNKASYTQPRARYGAAGPQAAPPRRKVLTLIAPTPPFTNNTDFIFFFPDWVERVPVCADEADFEDVIEPFMAFIGFQITRDLMFLTKFTRLGKRQLQEALGDPFVKKPTETDYSNPIVAYWVRTIRLYLLPALSLVRANAVCCVDVWGILRFFDAAERWRFYGEWQTVIYQSSGEMQVRRRQVERESKAIMRRLSLQTVESLQTSVAKLAHSNPVIIFSIAVNQAMAYPNMAEVIMRSLKFVLNMGFDVLVFTVISILANPSGRERYKPDGVNASDWLQNLARFIGMMLARYTVDPSTLLQYVMHQFTNDVISEVIIVRELIERMSYIEPLPSLSDTQVRIMSGGPILRIEAVASRTRGARSDPQDQTSRAPARLVRHLLESGMARPLLIQVAKLRQEAAKNTKNTQLKSVASLFDNVHGVFLQYLELVQTTSLISVEQYAKEIAPPLAELGDLYDISAPMCMQIFRPLLTAAVKETAFEYQRREKWENEQAERRLAERLKAREEKKSKETTPSPATTSDNIAALAKTNGDASTSTPTLKPADSDVDMTAVPTEPAPPPPKYAGPWLPRLEAFFGDVEKVVPQIVLDTLGPGFYITFWQMTTSDLGVPDDKYGEEIKNLQAYVDEEHKEYLRTDRIRSLRSEANGHWMREKRAKEYIELLRHEVNEQIDSRQFTIKRLAKEYPAWFAPDKKAALIASIAVEHCLIPRALLSPMDAEYAAQMIKTMHALGTPNWHTLKVYDLLLGEQIRAMTFSCSEYEARNYGRFLCAILKHLNSWYEDKNEYEKGQTKTVNGRITAHLHGMARTCRPTPADQSEHTPYADFQKLVRKWHRNISICLKDLVETDEYMRVYNAVIILKEILPAFPLLSVSAELGQRVDQPVKALLDKEMALPLQERRSDLMTVAQAYHSALHKRESYWMPKAPPKPRDAMSRAPSSTMLLPTAPANGTPRPQATPSSGTPQPQVATNGEKATATPPPSRPIDAVPRPEVVRRVNRPDTPTQPAVNGNNRPPSSVNAGPNPIPPRPPTQLRDQPGMAPPTRPARDAVRPMAPSRSDMRNDMRMDTRSDSPTVPPPMHRIPSGNGREPSRTVPNLMAPLPVAPHRQQQQLPLSPHPRPQDLRREGPGMPPPMAPSQTPSAQELRETARQTMNRKAEEQAADERQSRAPPTEPRNSRAPSPSTRRRSVSPPTQPGTRNHSMDSRGSSGRARETERGEDRIGDHDARAPDRRDRRERTTTREAAERDKDRGRDRHGDRERKDRERDKEREVREKERGSEREREGHRGDRHRRDEKERDVAGRALPPDAPRRDRIPTDPSTSDDAPGVKRRRAPDEEPDRATKRTKEKERRDRDRARRAGVEDKEHDRVRRRDRDVAEADKTGSPLPVSTPSAPRAMATGEASRRPSIETSGRDRERIPRDMRDNNGGPPPSPHLASEQSSLLSRISTNHGERQRIPQGPRSGVEPSREYNRGEPPQGRRNEGAGLRADGPAFRSDAMPRRESGRREPPGGPRLNEIFDLPPHRQGPVGDRGRMDEQDMRRKRTIADRERDSPVADPSISSPEPSQQNKKSRVRIDRTRALGRG